MSENMSKIPSPAERVVRVIEKNEAKSKAKLEIANTLHSEANAQQTEASDLRAAERDLESQIESAKGIQATRDLLEKLMARITGKAELERSELETLEKKLQKLQYEIALAEEAEKRKTKYESEAEKATKASVHAKTVADANRRNISADTGRRSGETPRKLSEEERVARKKQAAAKFQELNPDEQKRIKEKERNVDWQERVVPIELTESGKESLKRQSEISETLKFYGSENVEDFNKYQADELKYLMSPSLIDKLKQIIKTNKEDHYSGASDEKIDEEINKLLIGITPLYEQIVRLSESKDIQIDEQLIIKAFTEGLNITKNKNKDSVYRFVRQKKGREIGPMDVSYYAISAATMQEFFDVRKNIVGEERLPYILAYAAGELVNNALPYVALDLRNLISEVIPVEHNSGEKSPLGFGYSLTNNILNYDGVLTTRDEGVVSAFTQANKIVLDIFDKLMEKRQFEIVKRFTFGMGFGRPDFSRLTPLLVR